MANPSLQLNLEKSRQALVLNLQKAGVVKPPELEVGFGLDVSGSFEDEHVDGITNELIIRLVPWGLVFDPDQKLDAFTFSDGAHSVQDIGPVNASNCASIIRDKVVEVRNGLAHGKVTGWNGGTDYSYLLERFLSHFGWTDQVKKPGFFGRLMGQADSVVPGDHRRTLAIIITDGANSDTRRTRQVLESSMARGDEVFFLFLGVSNQGSKFPFLEQINDSYANTGFYAIKDLRNFLTKSDDELNSALISPKLLAWLKK